MIAGRRRGYRGYRKIAWEESDDSIAREERARVPRANRGHFKGKHRTGKHLLWRNPLTIGDHSDAVGIGETHDIATLRCEALFLRQR